MLNPFLHPLLALMDATTLPRNLSPLLVPQFKLFAKAATVSYLLLTNFLDTYHGLEAAVILVLVLHGSPASGKTSSAKQRYPKL